MNFSLLLSKQGNFFIGSNVNFLSKFFICFNRQIGTQKNIYNAPNRKVMIAIIMKMITRIFAISIENPATPLAPNM